MATLKVYSREYGVRKVQEKVKFNFLEKTAYGVFVGVILLANVVMLNYKGEIYDEKRIQFRRNQMRRMCQHSERTFLKRPRRDKR